MQRTETDELQAVRLAVREFVDRHVLPREREIEASDQVPVELLDQARDMGLFGVAIPQEYGGLGLGTVGVATVFEELGKAILGFGIAVGTNTGIGLTSLLVAGTSAQKDRYLPRMATGAIRSCFALTEPDAGSDAARIRTRAVRRGDHWLLSGTKCFITNGAAADLLVVFAVTDPARGTRGISAFLVEKHFPGFAVARVEEKMGLHGCHTAELTFADCEVPAENLLGTEGMGYVTALQTLASARITLSARCCGAMDRIIRECIGYARHRHTFGQPIAGHQLVQAHLADMAVDHAAARALVYDTAYQRQSGQPCIKEAALTKLFTTEAFGRVADRGVQIFGGSGYMKGTPVERYYRDARITRIFDGTSEIQRLLIARQLLQA